MVRRRVQKQARKKATAEGPLEKPAGGLVALGVPGRVLLVAISVSGFAGGAALTHCRNGGIERNSTQD